MIALWELRGAPSIGWFAATPPSPDRLESPDPRERPLGGPRCLGTSLAAEDAQDERVQPPRDYHGDAAALDLEFEGFALGRLGQGGDDLRQGHRPRIRGSRPASKVKRPAGSREVAFGV
jgi:hypothetical protein